MRLQFLFLNVHALQIHGRFQSGAAASYVYERRSLQRSLDARNTRLNHRRTGHWGRVEDLPHHRRTPSSEDSPPSAPHQTCVRRALPIPTHLKRATSKPTALAMRASREAMGARALHVRGASTNRRAEMLHALSVQLESTRPWQARTHSATTAKPARGRHRLASIWPATTAQPASIRQLQESTPSARTAKLASTVIEIV